MPVSVKGGIELRKALKEFTPDLAKETQKEMADLLRPITIKAKGYIPRQAPLSGWARVPIDGKFPEYIGSDAKGGVGYKTTPSKVNSQGYRSLSRIQNASASGALYETAGRTHPNGREQAKRREVVIPYNRRDTGPGEYRYTTTTDKTKYGRSNNPAAGNMFIQAINQYSIIKDAGLQTGAGRRSRKMKGRAIFRAWAEDGGKTKAAVIKAIEVSRDKFNAAVGYN
jgi:hypothetical protein